MAADDHDHRAILESYIKERGEMWKKAQNAKLEIAKANEFNGKEEIFKHVRGRREAKACIKDLKKKRREEWTKIYGEQYYKIYLKREEEIDKLDKSIKYARKSIKNHQKRIDWIYDREQLETKRKQEEAGEEIIRHFKKQIKQEVIDLLKDYKCKRYSCKNEGLWCICTCHRHEYRSILVCGCFCLKCSEEKDECSCESKTLN